MSPNTPASKTWNGLVDVEMGFPSPKSQVREKAVLGSLKDTENGAHPLSTLFVFAVVYTIEAEH